MPSEQDLRDAALSGDEQAYRRLVEPYRAALHAHCYRMLGSLSDADDALQDALLGAWKGLAGFEGRSSFKSWLYTVATHACLKLGAQRRPRIMPAEHAAANRPHDDLPAPLEQAHWVGPYPDDAIGSADGLASPAARYEERESIELAFIVLLQHLPPTQRAALILRDVLGFSAEEAAASLETSVASANSALQRARQTLEQRRPAQSQQAIRRALGDDAHKRLVERFINAWSRADVEAIVSMLAEDAHFSMPPFPFWFSGRDDIRMFLAERVFALRWRWGAARANGQPATQSAENARK